MESPGTGRASVRHGLHSLDIVIPAQRNWFALAFLGIWLLGWVGGEFVVGRMLFFDPEAIEDIARGFLVIWLVIWTIGGVMAGYQFLWMLYGKEVIRVGTGVFTIEHQLLSWNRKKDYDISSIHNLRVNDLLIEPGVKHPNYRFRRRRVIPGSFAFDYGYKTITFGQEVDLAEAHHLLDHLKNSPRLKEENFATDS